MALVLCAICLSIAQADQFFQVDDEMMSITTMGDSAYVLTWGQALYVITPGEQDIRPVMDQVRIAGENTEIIGMDDLYFLLDGIDQAHPLLCRYDVARQAFGQLSIPNIRSYVPVDAGQGLAICEDAGGTLLLDINWQDGTAVDHLRLKGQWAAFASDEAQGRAVRRGCGRRGLCAAQGPQGAGAREVSLRHNQAEAGVVLNDNYVVMGRLGLHRPDFQSPAAQERVLTVLFGAVDEVDIQFMQDHPGVRVEYLRGDAYEGMDFTVALVSGAISYDIGFLSNNTAAGENLMDKGYCMDLSVTPELVHLVDGMYAPFRAFAYHDRQLMMVPQNTRLQGEYVLWEDRMEKAGLTRDQLPDTMKACWTS